MPECLLWAYAEQKPRLEAEQARNAAMVAMFPNLKVQDRRDWLAALARTIARVTAEATGVTWNGAAISVSGLRRRLSRALAGGYSE